MYGDIKLNTIVSFITQVKKYDSDNNNDTSSHQIGYLPSYLVRNFVIFFF